MWVRRGCSRSSPRPFGGAGTARTGVRGRSPRGGKGRRGETPSAPSARSPAQPSPSPPSASGSRRGRPAPPPAAPPPGRRPPPRPARPAPAARSRSPSPAGSGTSRPAVRARDASFAASASPGWPSGTPSVTELRRFSSALVRSQCALTSSGVSRPSPRRRHADAGGSAWRRCRPPRRRWRTAPPGRSSAIRAWKTTWSSTSPSSSRSSSPVTLLDGLDEFVRLLDAVLRQALVGLPGRPRALRPDAVHHLDEVEQTGARQVVGGGQQLQLGHPHPAGARPAGPVRRSARGSPSPRRHDHQRPPAGAAVDELLRRSARPPRPVIPASRRYGSCGWSRRRRTAPGRRACSSLPGGPGQQAGSDPMAGGEQDDTAGAVLGRRCGAECVHGPKLAHSTDSSRVVHRPVVHRPDARSPARPARSGGPRARPGQRAAGAPDAAVTSCTHGVFASTRLLFSTSQSP